MDMLGLKSDLHYMQLVSNECRIQHRICKHYRVMSRQIFSVCGARNTLITFRSRVRKAVVGQTFALVRLSLSIM